MRDMRFEELNELILQDLEKSKKKKDKNGIARNVVFLTVLRNGCRVSEAMEFLYCWAMGYPIEKVRLRKRKTVEYRPMKLPKEITQEDLKVYLEWVSIWVPKYPPERLQHEGTWRRFHKWLAKAGKFLYPNELQINTTTLRHAWIKHQLSKGVSPKTIKRITGLRRLDHILKDFAEEDLLG